MRLLITFLIFIIVVLCASGTITMSNEYYTNGATVQENLQYNNMNFDNSVYIGQDIVSSIGNAEPAGNTSSYSDSTRITSTTSGTTIGGYVGAKGDLGPASSSVVGGRSNNIGLSYALGSGDVESGSYNAYTQSRVRTHTENNAQSFGSVGSSLKSIGISGGGTGSSYGNAGKISFEQDIWLSHMGKMAEIDSGIKMIRKEGLKPVTYGWGMGVASDGSRMAESGEEIQIAAGDCDTNALILGTSSALPNRENAIRLIPLDISDTKDTNTGNILGNQVFGNLIDLLKRSLVEKKLFMSYEISP